MGRFDGKVAVITGAGQGLGLVAARMFADEGAKVIAVSRTADKLEKAIAGLNRPNITPYAMDCGVEDNWKNLIEFIKKNYGEIDILVNNAGVLLQKHILDMSFEEFKMVESSNQDSVFLGMKYCHEVLKKGVYSAIVNISSTGGMRAGMSTGNDAGYHATKAASRHLTKHASFVFAPDCIRVNSVHPSGINTEMLQNYLAAYPEVKAGMANTNPLPPYYSEPEEVVEAIMFLCDPASRSITGAEVVIDNGAMAI